MKTKNNAADPKLTRQIEDLIKFKGGGHNEAEVADIIGNALKMLTDVKDNLTVVGVPARIKLRGGRPQRFPSGAGKPAAGK